MLANTRRLHESDFKLSSMQKYRRSFTGRFNVLRKPKVTRYFNLKFRTDEDIAHEARRLIYKQRYELKELLLVDHFLHSSDRVVEFGGCMGVVSCAIAARIKPNSLHVYEPNPDTVGIIKDNLALNKLKAEVINAGVDVKDGRQTFFISKTDILSSSALISHADAQEHECAAVGINAAIARAQANTIIMDIEGAEINVLAAADLSSINTIIVETHPRIVGREAIVAMHQDLLDKGLSLSVNGRVCVYTR